MLLYDRNEACEQVVQNSNLQFLGKRGIKLPPIKNRNNNHMIKITQGESQENFDVILHSILYNKPKVLLAISQVTMKNLLNKSNDRKYIQKGKNFRFITRHIMK